MIRLEELKVGMRVCGLVPEQIVEIIQVLPIKGFQELGNAQAKPIGYTVYFKHSDASQLEEKSLMCRDDHRFYEAEDKPVVGDKAQIARLAWEARRIKNAHLFDRYHSVFASDIQLLPHQIEAVYEKMLGRHPLRYLLADDPGAGKTIMAGLLIRELMARDVVRRCLIMVPGNLVDQWQEELRSKFRLSFTVCDLRQDARSFSDRELVIVRMDQAKRDKYEQMLKESKWDLIVCDEAHKMSATFSGGEIEETQRYQLGELLRGLTTHYLLMSATPHNGKEEDFQLFLRLLDEDRFEGRFRDGVRRLDTSDLVLRRMKEDLKTLEGKPLFPERKAYTADFKLSVQEQELYEAVTTYCQEEFNRAERLESGRRNTVGFALTVLQRRLASSPEAIYQSLKSRRQRLESKRTEFNESPTDLRELPDPEDLDDMPAAKLEELEEEYVDLATAARSKLELEKEIDSLKNLEFEADSLRRSNVDSKWERLREIWDKRLPEMEKNGQRRKLIIFSEHRATLSYLVSKLTDLLDDSSAIAQIHGGIPMISRRMIQNRFQNDDRIQVLVATDAAGEGINLQHAHLMVNYDLPWNPNRIEQRFGRIHRIGQSEVCHLWNIVTRETREGAVYLSLLDKLEKIREALGGKVFDVLGQLFESEPFSGLLREALRYGDDPERQAKLQRKIEGAVNLPRIQELMNDLVLADDVIAIDQTRDNMYEVGEERLHGSDVKSFLFAVFDLFSEKVCQIRIRDCGCYQITKVPGVIADDKRNSGIKGIHPEYRHICFDKDSTLPANRDCTPEYVGPGHPLIEAAAGWIKSHWKSQSPKCGEAIPILLDTNANGDSWRALFYLEWAIQNADSGGTSIDRKAQFIEVDSTGEPRKVSASSYLAYQLAGCETEKEVEALFGHIQPEARRLTEVARNYAAGFLAQRHQQEINKRESQRLDKVEAQVKESLQAEIAHQQQLIDNNRAQEQRFPERSAAYYGLRVQAERRRDDLESRLERRMQEIARQRQISPTGIIVQRVAFIVPASLLHK